MEPFVAWLMRKGLDCRFLVVLGYLLLLGGTFMSSTVTDLRMFVLFTGVVAQIGASILGVTSLLVLWEWYTPFTRGLVSGFGIGVQLLISSMVLMTQQILSDPRFIRATDVTPEERIHSNI